VPILEHRQERETFQSDMFEDRINDVFGSLHRQIDFYGGWESTETNRKITEQFETVVVMAESVK
jgi:hypothetical protein